MAEPYKDVSGDQKYTTLAQDEREALLSQHSKDEEFALNSHNYWRAPFYPHPRSRLRITVAFLAGIIACASVQFLMCTVKNSSPGPIPNHVHAQASERAGSTERHDFPPSAPTNAFPSLFPSNVGYAGPTPTGAEPALVATAPAYPLHTGVPNILAPAFLPTNDSSKNGSASFDVFRHLGNLSPWFSVEKGGFGVDSSPEAPEACSITALHLLHRHGARYPAGYEPFGSTAKFAERLHNSSSKWSASGSLSFMNDWTYKLGEEVLTPFGRQQLLDLGVSTRLKYGFLLENFTASNMLPVFRTESSGRMVASALNFAIGFFGYPFEGQYQQSITISDQTVNNTLAPFNTCPNIAKAVKQLTSYLQKWTNTYLAGAQARLTPSMVGYDFTIEDIYVFQQLCAYETVALGYSKFCELFTEEEWKGFDYAIDLELWYSSGFGSPVASAQGIGYVQELVSRLTSTRIPVHNSSTNATLDDDPVTFPFGQSLYVDASHDVVVLNILAALNLTNFAAGGPLPLDHIPENRAFKTSHLVPFAANMHFQVLSCQSIPDPQIRIILNDGVVPLTSIRGCPKQKDGMCPLATFVEAQKEMIRTTDWDWGCRGDWDILPEWETTEGKPPAPP